MSTSPKEKEQEPPDEWYVQRVESDGIFYDIYCRGRCIARGLSPDSADAVVAAHNEQLKNMISSPSQEAEKI